MYSKERCTYEQLHYTVVLENGIGITVQKIMIGSDKCVGAVCNATFSLIDFDPDINVYRIGIEAFGIRQFSSSVNSTKYIVHINSTMGKCKLLLYNGSYTFKHYY